MHIHIQPCATWRVPFNLSMAPGRLSMAPAGRPASARLSIAPKTPGKVNPKLLSAQLQALHARPELLALPEFADVVAWVRRVAEQIPPPPPPPQRLSAGAMRRPRY